MGAGPEALLAAGIEQALRDRGHAVHTRMAEIDPDTWHSEIKTGFDLMRMLAIAVREARNNGRLPVVLAGNCNTCVGTLAGLGVGTVGVAWFDAHGDFNTPETTTSGFLDGTALAIVTGRCWKQLTVTVPGFQPIKDERVCIIGARDLDTLEGRLLRDSNVDVVAPADLKTVLPRAMGAIAQHVEKIYVHLDLDVLDADVARANHFAGGGGLTVEEVEFALSVIASDFCIAAITLSAYDPTADSDGNAARAAIRLVCAAAALAREG
jgi:arginase